VPFIRESRPKTLAKLAVQVMPWKILHDLGVREDLDIGLKTFNVKAPRFPVSHQFPGGCDVLFGPEMKSTGEVMGRGPHFFGRLRESHGPRAGMPLPEKGDAFLSISE